MHSYRETVSHQWVSLPRRGFKQMAALVKALYRLSRNAAYRAAVCPDVPEIARCDPGHDALMMGYDFHWTAQGPRLIEVNTNAGGWLPALLARFGAGILDPGMLPARVRARLIEPFSEEIRAWSGGERRRPTMLAIVDEQPAAQFLFGEMEYCRRLLTAAWNLPVGVVDPQELDAGSAGVFSAGQPVELIYNRHCDFYLESAALAGIRAAYRARRLCLSPNPFCYGLLADKRRLVLWSDPAALAKLGVPETERRLLTELVPPSRLLAELDRETLWRERAAWVFKPVTRFGSRGVLLGRKITRGRFDALDPTGTLAQRLVPPSLTNVAGGAAMKTDFRLYVYRDRVLGVTARLYRGQVTNLRTPGGGFAAVRFAE